jgi:hypothetical protein
MKNPVVIPTYPPSYEYPPSDYRNIHGRPSVTVSPRGLTLGTSKYFNDGADFGPDTPGTSTCGIQEALNNGGPVKLLSGTYTLTSEISPKAGSRPVLIGDGWGVVQGPNWGVPNSGTILKQTTSGKSVIHVTEQLGGFELYGVAMVGATGAHGLFFDPETMLSGVSAPTSSDLIVCQGLIIEDVLIRGGDASHVAYWFGNIVNFRISNIQMGEYGGYMVFDSYNTSTTTASYNFGNGVITGYCQAFMNPNGSVDAIDFLIHDNASLGQILNGISVDATLDLAGPVYDGPPYMIYFDNEVQRVTISRLNPQDTGNSSAIYIPNAACVVKLFDGDDWNSYFVFPQNPPQIETQSPAIQSIVGSQDSATAGATLTTYTPEQDALLEISVGIDVKVYTSGTIDITVAWQSSAGLDRSKATSASATGWVDLAVRAVYVKAGQSVTVTTSGTFSASYDWAVAIRRYM